jgi:hypothetical protein
VLTEEKLPEVGGKLEKYLLKLLRRLAQEVSRVEFTLFPKKKPNTA